MERFPKNTQMGLFALIVQLVSSLLSYPKIIVIQECLVNNAQQDRDKDLMVNTFLISRLSWRNFS